MNKHLVLKINEYCKKYNVKPPNMSSNGVIDPGAKTPSSITDKVIRKVEIEEDKNFKLYNISDFVRGTIIVSDFASVPNLILNLKKNIPNLYGYISSWTNGYRGIHLNFSINGINAEIQIHTPETFAVTKATAEVYAKWRNYNPQKEIKTLLKLKEENSPLFETSKAKFWQVRSKYGKENKDTQSLYAELWNNVNFNKFEPLISTILYKINKIDVKNKNIDQKLQNSLHEELINPETGLVDRYKTLKNATFINSNSTEKQKGFVEKLKNIYYNSYAETNQEYCLSDFDKKLILLLHKWDKSFEDSLKLHNLDKQLKEDFCSIINYKKFQYISDSITINKNKESIIIDDDSLQENTNDCVKNIKTKQKSLLEDLEKLT